MDRKKFGWTVGTLLGLLIGIICVCFGSISHLQNEASDIEALNLHCIRVFGNHYENRNPPGTFGASTGARLKHDSGLQSLQAAAKRLLGPDVRGHEVVLRRLLSKLAQNPTDSTRIFLFASACAEEAATEANVGGSFWEEGRHRYWITILRWLFAQPGDALIRARKADKSFEWMRARFLVESCFGDRAGLVPLGRQLLAEDPSDDQLLAELAHQLGDIRTEADTREALNLCQRGIAELPNSPMFYNLEAYAYESRWLGLGHRRADGELTIQWTEKALSRIPKGAFLEPQLRRRIEAMKQLMSSQH